MNSRSLLGLSLAGMLAWSVVGCETKEAPPAPAPDKVEEAKATSSAAPKAEEAPKAEAKAEAPKKEEAPQKEEEPKAEAKAKAAPEAEVKSAAPKAEAKAGAAGKSAVPNAPNGILPKGAADKLVKSGGRPVVRLIAAGAEPRAAASYALVKGTSKPFRMDMDLEMSMKAGGMNMPPTKMPRMGMLFDFTTGDRKDRDWPIEGTLKEVTVSSTGPAQDKLTELLRPQLGAMKGIGMNYFVDEKGRVRDVKMSVPATVPEAAQQMMTGMTQSIESMMAPLPEEPVGQGASWEVLSRITANGADLLQVSTFTLKKRDGDELTLDVALKQLAAKDTVAPPGMPPGASARLVAFDSKGGGSSVLDVKDVAPKSGSTNMKSSMSLEVKVAAAGQTEKTSVETKVVVTYARPSAK